MGKRLLINLCRNNYRRVADMTRPVRTMRKEVSVEAPPPYGEVTNDASLSASLRAASSPKPIKSPRSTLPCERETPSKDSTTYPWVAETSTGTINDIPPGTELVQAPYELQHKNSSIIRDFLVFDSNPTDTLLPDVSLRTKNALINSRVYVNEQEWARPVSIYTRTKNADIILGVVRLLVLFVLDLPNANVPVYSIRSRLARLSVCEPPPRTVRLGSLVRCGFDHERSA